MSQSPVALGDHVPCLGAVQLYSKVRAKVQLGITWFELPIPNRSESDKLRLMWNLWPATLFSDVPERPAGFKTWRRPENDITPALDSSALIPQQYVLENEYILSRW